MIVLPNIPRLSIVETPTPLMRLRALSKALGGPSFWMKRDDLTPLAFGGNKLRKLEFHLAEALAQGASHLVTLGAEQSNHACQTAAAARRFGFQPVLLLRGPPDAPRRGNLFLAQLFGAEIRLDPTPPEDWGAAVTEELRQKGHRPYLIPYGGSNALGALGYLVAGGELAEETKVRAVRFDEIVVASSSGGTQAGLLLARTNAGLEAPVLGVSAELEASRLAARVMELARTSATHFGLEEPVEGDLHVTSDYLDGGYAKFGSATKEAIELLARTEGIVTDPVYTGKAVGAAIDLARRGRWRKEANVLLWHTGGLPAVLTFDALLA